MDLPGPWGRLRYHAIRLGGYAYDSASRLYTLCLERFYSSIRSSRLNRFRYRRWQKHLIKTLRWGFNHSGYRRQLRHIREECGPGPLLIYPSVIHWNHYLFQRPHQMFREMARRGVNVFFCTPDPRRDQVRGFKKLAPHLYLCESVACVAPLKHQPVWIWIGWTAALPLLDFFEKALSIYELIDELELFAFYCDLMERDHGRLLRDSHVVLASADRLLQAITPLRPDVKLVTNGVAVEDFILEGTPKVPPDLQKILDRGHPVVGYYGALSPWLDYSLIETASHSLPQMEFVFIGPDYEGAAVHLPQYPNVHWLGPKPYQELKYYLAWFDVATIPFRRDRVTHAISPLKLFEYMAGGKPVVARDLEELRKYPEVLRATDAADWMEKIKLGIRMGKDPDMVRRLKRVAWQNSWARKVDQVLEAMQEVAPNPSSPDLANFS